EEVELREPAHLIDALEQEVELRWQGEARHVLVEAGEKRVLLGCLEQRVCVEMVCELSGEAGFASSDRPVDDDVAAALEFHRGASVAGERGVSSAASISARRECAFALGAGRGPGVATAAPCRDPGCWQPARSRRAVPARTRARASAGEES